jgi:RNA polymerase sigma-70 factor, ECF subfamily
MIEAVPNSAGSGLPTTQIPLHTAPAEEWALVERARAGDQEAFAELIRPHTGKVYRITLKITQCHEDAEDAAQEALLNAYKYLGTFQGGSRFSSWLVRIAINEARMKLRKRRTANHVSLEDLPAGQDQPALPHTIAGAWTHPDSMYQQAEARELLMAAIKRMRPALRDTVVLRGLHEQSESEAAKLLDLSISAVKTRFRRGRLELREQLASNMVAWAS